MNVEHHLVHDALETVRLADLLPSHVRLDLRALHVLWPVPLLLEDDGAEDTPCCHRCETIEA